MADKNIGELPQAPQVQSDSLIPMEQNGQAMRMSGEQFAEWARESVADPVSRAEASAAAAKESETQAAASATAAAASKTSAQSTLTNCIIQKDSHGKSGGSGYNIVAFPCGNQNFGHIRHSPEKPPRLSAFLSLFH